MATKFALSEIEGRARYALDGDPRWLRVCGGVELNIEQQRSQNLKRGVAKLVKDFTQGEWILLGIGAAIILILIVGGYIQEATEIEQGESPEECG